MNHNDDDDDNDNDNDKEKLVFAKFNIDGSLIHENLDFGGRQFRWRFVEEENEDKHFDRFSLKRNSDFIH